MWCCGAVVEMRPRRGLEIPYDGDGQLGIGGEAWVENLRGRGVGHQACLDVKNFKTILQCMHGVLHLDEIKKLIA